MITKQQREECKARRLDIVFENNGKVYGLKSERVRVWNEEEQEWFFEKTGLRVLCDICCPVFYDPRYFSLNEKFGGNRLHYCGGNVESKIPQPINLNDYSYLFCDCENLTTLDLSHWDVSNVTSMYSMFEGCSSLLELNLSNWDVSNVTSMSSMFLWCFELESLYSISYEELEDALKNGEWTALTRTEERICKKCGSALPMIFANYCYMCGTPVEKPWNQPNLPEEEENLTESDKLGEMPVDEEKM